MAQRQIAVLLRKECDDKLKAPLQEHKDAVIEAWQTAESDERHWHYFLLHTEDSQSFLDALNPLLEEDTVERILVTAVEASLPLTEREEKTHTSEKKKNGEDWFFNHITREELYNKIEGSCRLDATYLLFIILSTIVGMVALMQDNIPALIGAMVITPVLGPNLALGFAVTIGDLDLFRKGLKAAAAGLTLVLLLSCLGGFFFSPPEEGAITRMTQVGYNHILIGLCSGVAAVFSLSQTQSLGFVGVMVAVALLPPTVAAGLYAGAGMPFHAAETALLLAINVVCFNLAAHLSFLALGIRPQMQSWLKEKDSQKTLYGHLSWWGVSLLILIAIVYFIRDN